MQMTDRTSAWQGPRFVSWILSSSEGRMKRTSGCGMQTTAIDMLAM